MTKRELGQYLTDHNPLDHPAFWKWARKAGLPEKGILEPFAGGNHLIHHLEEMGLCRMSRSYDIQPQNERVIQRDTLADFPTGYSICVTNPPWLMKSAATRNDTPWPDYIPNGYADLYLFALERCLANCEWVAALIPQTFIMRKRLQERMIGFIALTHPISSRGGSIPGLALFGPDDLADSRVWDGLEETPTLANLRRMVPRAGKGGPPITFGKSGGKNGDGTIESGNVGIGTFDLSSIAGPNVRFRHPDEIPYRPNTRHYVRFQVDGEVLLDEWNERLRRFREDTHDLMLTSHLDNKRKDGKWARRLRLDQIRGIIWEVWAERNGVSP